ncbi:DUF302 domain-containing protein [candidate division GN15 bacterium]|nr:DUF302 domain-containing protein [candidate division GN15 bacterium]
MLSAAIAFLNRFHRIMNPTRNKRAVSQKCMRLQMNRIVVFILGIAAGAAITGLVVWTVMPSMMLTISPSSMSLNETVVAIEQSALNHGWMVPKVYDLQASLTKAGHADAKPMKILSLCQPDHAYAILSENENRKVTAMMPCRIGVFERDDGQVYVAQMNIGLMSKMFGGTIEKVMGQVAVEEHEMLQSILAQ